MLRENSQKNKNLQKSGRYKKSVEEIYKTYMDQAENEKNNYPIFQSEKQWNMWKIITWIKLDWKKLLNMLA